MKECPQQVTECLSELHGSVNHLCDHCFEQLPEKTYTSQTMATQYIRVELRRKSGIGERFKDLGIKLKNAKPVATYTFEFMKKWMNRFRR